MIALWIFCVLLMEEMIHFSDRIISRNDTGAQQSNIFLMHLEPSMTGKYAYNFIGGHSRLGMLRHLLSALLGDRRRLR